MKGISVPEVDESSDYAKQQIAIEYAFVAMVDSCAAQGLKIDRPMGLMYLSTEKLTSDFQNACKNILESLKTKNL